MQVKLTKFSYIETLFKVQFFIQVFVLIAFIVITKVRILQQELWSATMLTYIIMYQVSGMYMYPQGWSWSYSSWIYNYLCNECLSLLTLCVRISLRQDVVDATLCDKVSRWLMAGWWFLPGTPVSSTIKTDRHNITEILLKIALSTITLTPYQK
jgi:hypothetical protein